MSSTQFVEMYHPLIPSTEVTPARVPVQAIDENAARGWLLVDPSGVLPTPVTPYYTKEALLSQIQGGASPIGTALRAALVPKWKPSTAYASGEFVLSPSGQIVSANTAFTSGTTYSSSNWTVVSGGGSAYTDEQVRDVIGVTLVAGSGISKTVDDAGDTITISATGGGGAGLPATVVNRTTAYTAAAGEFVQADVTTASFTVTLPAAPTVGALVAVKKVDASANTLTIVASASGTIDGDPSATTTTKMAGAIFEHVGSNVWRIVASMTTTGPAGPTGAKGDKGDTGAAGPQGPGFVARGAWAATTVYAVNDIVTNGGSTYRSLTAHTSGASFSGVGANWELWAAKGTDGTGGTITVQDEGSALTARSTIDFVGAGVTATDDSANSRTLVTIPGGGGASFYTWAYRSQAWYSTPAGSSGTSTLANLDANLQPFFVPVTTTFDRICTEITTGVASALVRLAIYNSHTDGLPGTVLLDAGTVSAGAAAFVSATISQSLSPGLYWLAVMGQTGNSSAPALRTASFTGVQPGFCGLAANPNSGADAGVYWNAAGGGAAISAAASTSLFTAASAVRVYLRAA